MFRVLCVAILALATMPSAYGQELRVLHIKVVLIDADGKATPAVRHGLLVSDEPPSAAPRLVVTNLDGVVDVRLRPGHYVIESDKPVAFKGKAYQWVQMVDVVADRDAVLELTAENAEVEPLKSDPSVTDANAPPETDPSLLLHQWQESVVALWTPTMHASGFVIDARGLILTNQRVIGAATAVEVQMSPAIKVSAAVLASDAQRDVAVLWADAKVIATAPPLALGCGQGERPVVVRGQEIFTIGSPLRQEKGAAYGTVARVETHAIASDIVVAPGSAGGPVFTEKGLVGLTTVKYDSVQLAGGGTRVIPAADACDIVAAAEKKMAAGAAPSGTNLPVEPSQPFPVDALKEAVKRRAGSLNPYQISTSAFDVAFITPVMTFGVQYQADQMRSRERGRESRGAEPTLVRPQLDFGAWSEYLWEFPPVLLVRVTPRMSESFWTTVARGAARTQGVALPPLKRFSSDFLRMRAYCGDAEVTPIHPFELELRVSDDNAITEGLYVFDPGALGPHCGSVKLTLFSRKEPDKGETRVVDPPVVQQFWDDFAPYRASTQSSR